MQKRSFMVRVTQGCEVEPGAGEEAIEKAGLVLHPPEPGLGQRSELADAAFDEVGQGPLEVGPGSLSRLAMMQGSLDEQL
jgi:hypothetical protein